MGSIAGMITLEQGDLLQSLLQMRPYLLQTRPYVSRILLICWSAICYTPKRAQENVYQQENEVANYIFDNYRIRRMSDRTRNQ